MKPSLGSKNGLNPEIFFKPAVFFATDPPAMRYNCVDIVNVGWVEVRHEVKPALNPTKLVNGLNPTYYLSDY